MSLKLKIKEGLTDLSELQVQTFTGELSTEVIASGDGNAVLDWQKLIAKARAETTGEIELVAATNRKFDFDTDIFVSKSATSEQLEIHNNAVEAATKARQALVELLKDLIDVV